MENKIIKEELPDKDMAPSSASYASSEHRRSKHSSKDRCRSPLSPGASMGAERSPDGGGGSPSSGCAPHRSPHHNGSAGSSSPGTGAVSGGGGGAGGDSAGSGGRPPPARLKRFLSTLIQFASDISADVGDRVRSLVHSLVSSTISIEEFQQGLQEATNFPLRPFVLPFLRATLPPLQREVQTLARNAKQSPLQYVRSHEAVALEPGSSEPADIFLGTPASPTPTKRSLGDPFYDGPIPQTNGSHHPIDAGDYPPQPKRPHPSGLLVNPSPLLFPLQAHSHLFEYPHPYHIGFHGGPQSDGLSSNYDLRRESSARENMTGNMASAVDQRAPTANMASGLNLTSISNSKNDEEWKNINTMLNCILSMVEKTKRALAILQQRGNTSEGYSPEGVEMKRTASEIMAATVRQTEERVSELRRRAEDSVNQVKRQAVAELQRAAAAERARLERLLRLPASRRAASQSPPPPDHHNSCWNCGRKAQETCSGCNVARYCGAFCQHKDWENHHQVCCGRDQKPPSSALLTVTSPPSQAAQSKTSQITRSATPVSSSTSNDRLNITNDRHSLSAERISENRLSLSSLNNAERLLTSAAQDRINLAVSSVSNAERLNITVSGVTNSERLSLASISSGQGLVSGVGGKK